MDKKILAASVLLFTFLLTPALVLAQSSAVDFIWVRTFGFERQWLNNPNQLIVNALLPAVAIYAIFLGMMRTIRISYGMGNIEHLIAVVVMLAALFTGGIGYISALLAGLGQFSVWVFVILFIVGAILYSIGFVRKRSAMATIWSTYKTTVRDIDKKIKEAAEARDRLIKKGGDLEKILALEKRQAMLEDQRREVVKTLRDAEAAA